MSQWVRLWEDMPNDPKWRVVARRAGRPVSEVLAVFIHMMTVAGRSKGEIDGWEDEDVAMAIDAEPEHVAAIREAMQGKTLDGDRLTGWSKRQPAREDGSAERAKAWRERNRPQENASERTQTQTNAPEEKREDTDTDQEDLLRKSSSREAGRAFDDFWSVVPRKVGIDAARKAFLRIVATKKATGAEILVGAIRWRDEARGDDPKFVPHPATWLNRGGWTDEPRAHRPDARAGPSGAGNAIEEVRRRLRENGHGRGHDTNDRTGAGATEPGASPPRGRAAEQDRDRWDDGRRAGPLLDLVAERPH